MGVLIIIIQFILSLSILVTLHEFGHFLPAKWFGMRVEKFYLFFNPWFSLYKTQRGETEWGVGWLPLGGYVKIAGMIDESMDTEQMNQPPQEWEFRSKPAWQRLIVMLGGVTINFLLGFFIFSILLWVYGDRYLPMDNAKYGIAVNDIGAELGLQNGDVILQVGDKAYDKLSAGPLVSEIVINMANEIQVRRNGEIVTIEVPDSTAQKLASNSKKAGPIVMARLPMVAGEVMKKTPAKEAGIQEGDSIIACNGMETRFFDQFTAEVARHKGEEITVTLIREGEDDPQNIKLTPDEDGKIGIRPFGEDRYFEMETVKYSFFAAFPVGTYRAWDFLVTNVRAMGQMITGTGHVKASESLGGFVSIAKLFDSSWNWYRFWQMTAILSLILGFMNLLPIPALDGGHALFLLIEIVMRRPVPQKVMEYAQIVGFVILIALLVYANGMDIIREIRGS
jgi:regulator of sigma E protease